MVWEVYVKGSGINLREMENIDCGKIYWVFVLGRFFLILLFLVNYIIF